MDDTETIDIAQVKQILIEEMNVLEFEVVNLNNVFQEKTFLDTSEIFLMRTMVI